jgi:hypothetical protein
VHAPLPSVVVHASTCPPHAGADAHVVPPVAEEEVVQAQAAKPSAIASA